MCIRDRYKRIREEYNFKDVALLHSERLQKYIEESVDEQRKDDEEKSAKEKFEKTKMFSAPLTISTCLLYTSNHI